MCQNSKAAVKFSSHPALCKRRSFTLFTLSTFVHLQAKDLTLVHSLLDGAGCTGIQTPLLEQREFHARKTL
jgi:hypothetical protein